MFKAINLRNLLVNILAIEAVGLLSGFISGMSPAEYDELIQPIFSPRPDIFGIACVVIYAILGTVLYSIKNTHAKREDKVKVTAWFFAVLCLNFSWPVLFFNLNLFGLAIINILTLMAVSAVSIRLLRKISKASVFCLLIYLAWLVYLLYFNYGIWTLNQ